MHDPCTVAHEIKYPWKKYGRKSTNAWERDYRESFITIWHRDPEKRRGKQGTRLDDTCGWFRPPYTKEDAEKTSKLAEREYGHIFEKQHRTAQGADYARVCFEPTCYDAIYWSWRALKWADRTKGWRYGDKKPALTPVELEIIYSLSACPVDNLRIAFSDVKDASTFEGFFFAVWSAYRRHNRPWYKHPRWHIWHWRIQFHPWQNLKRRFWTKCSKCGERGFRKDQQAIGNWGGTEIWHSTCDGGTVAAPQKEAA